MLSKQDFTQMHIKDVARFHGIKEVDFILAVFPSEKYIWNSEYYYKYYVDWYKKTQNKLAKALK